MNKFTELASQATIKIGGTLIADDVWAKVSEIVVDQHTHLPHMFSIRIYDPDLELLDKGPFDLTKEILIEAETEDNHKFTLIKGEITALEPSFNEGMNPELVVRGYDQLHRLYRKTYSKAYLNVKDSDIASQAASTLGLQAVVDATSIVYDHVFQHNQSDLVFLAQRAWRIGYECFVSDGKLYFRKPPTPSTGISLTWGDDLLSFRPRLSLAEQVDEVQVLGWDGAKQKAIVGKSQAVSMYPKIGESKDGKQWAQPFGDGVKVIVDQPVVSQAEADILATARMNELAGAYIVAEGEAFRRPDIQAGKFVEIKGLGKRLSGTYLVTKVTHIYTPRGLREIFQVSGSRTGLLAEQFMGEPMDRWSGVVPALVTNTDDPQDMGRVKVKFPWLDDSVESDWARVLGLGVGNDSGLCLIPDVGDEVIVAFVHGDISQPVVLGGVWSSNNKLPKEVAGAGTGEKPQVTCWRSSSGHSIAIYDNADNQVEIQTAKGRSITLSDKDQKIILKTSQVTITIEDSKLSIESGGNTEFKSSASMTLEATGSLTIKSSGNLDINANGQVNIKGAMVNIN